VIDISKILNSKLSIQGLCNSSIRESLIERAIKMIMENPTGAFSVNYIGTKDYAHWTDQEVFCEYGMGPKHGTVVFRIGRKSPNTQDTLGEAEIYHLLCCRDFKGCDFGNLDQLIKKHSLLKEELEKAEKILSGIEEPTE
jgi:hypothetical protein